MSWIMKAVAFADGRPMIGDQYVKSCDFETRSGRGHVVMTEHPKKAKRFDTVKELMEFYQTPSKTVPLRPDGKPNRPITAWTVEITEI